MKFVTNLIRFFGILVTLFAVILYSAGGMSKLNLKTQRIIMRLVRDISRHKARKRSQSSHDYALVPLLLGRDSANDNRILNDLMVNDDSFEIISRKELELAKGLKEEDDLWVSVLGHVFDVKEGSKFYAKGGPYEMLAGRDATKALASGDLTVAKDFNYEVDQTMSEEFYDKDELAEAQRWLEYFVSHQKYKHVGRLPRTDDLIVNIDEIVKTAVQLEEDEDYDDEDEEKIPPKWHPPVLDDNASCPGGGK